MGEAHPALVREQDEEEEAEVVRIIEIIRSVKTGKNKTRKVGEGSYGGGEVIEVGPRSCRQKEAKTLKDLDSHQLE